VASAARVRLLEVDPDLAGPLSPEDFANARQLTIPLLTIEHAGADLADLRQPGVFAALVVSGMVLRQVRVAEQFGMRLHGPGDIVPMRALEPPMVVADSTLRALPDTRLALLGPELLFAAKRWPSLLAAFHLRIAQQADRVTAQLVICQLPRVDQRLLSLLWLLAESWGRVTPAGTSLPLKLTHEALGALVGARRPTVTLALRDLAERGAIVRLEEGWLLLESPPESGEAAERPPVPVVLEDSTSAWTPQTNGHAAQETAMFDSYNVLIDTVETLREQHAKNRDKFRERMTALARERERCRKIRRRIAQDRLTRQTARSPSS
jgi:CRP/FNR family transcriptional regulator, cyclic AMP receptor protein